MKEIIYKVVYKDDGKTKVVKGSIISEEEYLVTIEAVGTHKHIRIGKQAITSMAPVSKEQDYNGGSNYQP